MSTKHGASTNKVVDFALLAVDFNSPDVLSATAWTACTFSKPTTNADSVVFMLADECRVDLFL